MAKIAVIVANSAIRFLNGFSFSSTRLRYTKQRRWRTDACYLRELAQNRASPNEIAAAAACDHGPRIAFDHDLIVHAETKPGPGLIGGLAGAFDRLYSARHRKTLERWIVGMSAAGFLAHLGHIFLARNLANPPALIAAAGKNYLSAISTPFSLILFYEVLTVISAVPESTTRSIAKQFEIVSLIFIRGFFSDIATLDPDHLRAAGADLIPMLEEVGAGLCMFLLVTVFHHAASSRSREQASEGTEALRKFIERKKLLALVLTVIFVSLAVISMFDYGIDVYREIRNGGLPGLAPPTSFYSEVFTVMIFTDVLILILSLLVSDHYELVFRNAAFVISTILIRLSLTASHQDGALLGIAGMVFGMLTIVIYNYNLRVKALV